MAMLKFGNAALVTRVVDPDKWGAQKVAASRVKVAKEIFAKYDPSKWLLSHVTIIASVDVDGDNKDPKKNYLIKPAYSIFVNNNGDSWERGMLKLCYKTFLGADNYVEHVQIPELSKGKVIDVALRDIPFTKNDEGKDLNTLYADVLVATNKKHNDLVDKIQSGEYNAVSMGCQILYSICSQCGNVAEDEARACKHVRFFKNNYFYDENGIKRIIAELCGSSDNPNSCRFIDCSWVRKPAFEGAVLRNLVEPREDMEQKFQIALSVPSFKPEPGMLLRAASQAAQQIVNEIEAAAPKTDRFGQAAAPAPTPAAPAAPAPAVPAPEAPASDLSFPTAPTDTKSQLELDTPPTGDAPPADAGSPPADAGAPPADPAALDPSAPPMFGGAGGGAAPAAPAEPQIQEPPEDATVGEIKNLMKKQILNDLRREILKQQAKTQEAQRPKDMENETNDNMIKQAFFKKVYAASKCVKNDRLRNGFLLMSNLDNWENMKRYGYDRKDMLAMLCLIDRTISSSPVGLDTVKAMTKIKLGSDGMKGVFTELIVETGRKPSISEAKKVSSWVNILSQFDR